MKPRIVHVYEEESDKKTQNAFGTTKKIDEEKDEAEVIHEFVRGFNEQTYSRGGNGYE